MYIFQNIGAVLHIDTIWCLPYKSYFEKFYFYNTRKRKIDVNCDKAVSYFNVG